MQPVAFITGAGSGIGRATAISLSARGYRLALCGRTHGRLDTLCAELGANSLAIEVNVTDPQQVERAVGHAMQSFGRLDAVVNCAGVAPMLSIEDTPPATWREVLDTNLSGSFYVSRAVWPIFRAQGGGVIVNISSMAARDPFPNFSAYAAAKAGLNSLTLTPAREGQPLGISVYSVAPAAVETEMFRKLMPVEQVPSSQTLDPADVAALIVRCVVGDMKHSTGETLYVRRKL